MMKTWVGNRLFLDGAYGKLQRKSRGSFLEEAKRGHA
jgi:hypothetical protein